MLDDLMVIARNKVTDEKDFDDVLEDMKKEKKYAAFFDVSSDGTGSDNNGKGGKGKKENIGERLGKKQSAQPIKSSYFYSGRSYSSYHERKETGTKICYKRFRVQK